ncbi:hypothetical protein HAX54_008273, partial [Datura stramonium]|nr:hypothetical protein [Datura stramonium]
MILEQRIAELSIQDEASRVRERQRDIEFVYGQYGLVDEPSEDDDEDADEDDHVENTPPHYGILMS